MLSGLRRYSKDEGGFTLIELLVVILIIGILAAIAIPAFLNQKNKANDASAKTQARTGETAAETYSTDSNAGYTGMTIGKLQAIEATLNETGSATLVVTGTPTATEYTVTSTSKGTTDTFSVHRKSNGEIERTCTAPGTNKGGCPNGTW
jgi:type IV pilus assembly protein PilA